MFTKEIEKFFWVFRIPLSLNIQKDKEEILAFIDSKLCEVQAELKSANKLSIELTLNKFNAEERKCFKEIALKIARKWKFDISIGSIKSESELSFAYDLYRKIHLETGQKEFFLFSPFYEPHLIEEQIKLQEGTERNLEIHYAPALSSRAELNETENQNPGTLNSLDYIKVFPSIYQDEEEFKNLAKAPFLREAQEAEAVNSPNYESASEALKLSQALQTRFPHLKIIAAGIGELSSGAIKKLEEMKPNFIASSKASLILQASPKTKDKEDLRPIKIQK